MDIICEANSIKLVKAIKNVESYQQSTTVINQYRNPERRWRYKNKRITINFKVKNTFGIVPGKFKLKIILDKLQTKIRGIGDGLDQTKVTNDKDSDRVVISDNQKQLLISSYIKNSTLPVLGFAYKIRTNKDEYLLKNTITEENGSTTVYSEAVALVEHPNYTLIDNILIDGNTRYQSSLPPKLARLNGIFVYIDIIDTVLVGNTQAPMLGNFPIQCKWGDQSYWNLNPPYYVKVKESSIRTISIRLWWKRRNCCVWIWYSHLSS